MGIMSKLCWHCLPNVVSAKTCNRHTIIELYMKNKILLFFSILSLVVYANSVNAQNVTVNVEIDSFQRLIGEQAKITLEVTANTGSRIVLPNFDKELIEGIEIVHKSQPDTQYLNDKKRIEIKEVYTVTSFDSSLYVIPPFEVLVDGDPHFSKELALAVYTMPIDTTNLDAFFGPKDIWRTTLMWKDVENSFWLFILLIIFAIAFAWVLIRYINNKPVIRIVKIKPKLPSHVVALKEIERIKADDKWRAGGMNKEYYTELTDAIREYLNDRFGFNATEMTTGEIVDNLMRVSDKETIKELEELLVMADLVKFAKFEPAMNENDRNILNAIEFVNRTKLSEIEENPQPTEKKIVNKRSRREKRLLLLTVVILAIFSVAFLIMLVRELYYLIG